MGARLTSAICVSVNVYCFHCIFLVPGFSFSFLFFFFSTLSTNYPQSDPRREEENRRFCSRPFSRLDEYILASVIPLPYFARCFIALRPNFLNTWKKIKITTQWN